MRTVYLPPHFMAAPRSPLLIGALVCDIVWHRVYSPISTELDEVMGMFSRRALVTALGLLLASTFNSVFAQKLGEIAPTGSLRVAVAVGPAASAFWTTRDPATGKPRGVTVELAKAAAEKLHVPLQLVEYLSSDDIAAAGAKNAWDISFMPFEARRAAFVDSGPAYV